MMRTIKSVFLNLAVAALFYYGFVEGIEGAQNVVKFFVWAIALPIGLMLFSKDLIKSIAANPPMPKVVNFLIRLIAWAELVVLLWSGHIATSIAWAFYMLCAGIARVQIEKCRKEALGIATHPDGAGLHNDQAI